MNAVVSSAHVMWNCRVYYQAQVTQNVSIVSRRSKVGIFSTSKAGYESNLYIYGNRLPNA